MYSKESTDMQDVTLSPVSIPIDVTKMTVPAGDDSVPTKALEKLEGIRLACGPFRMLHSQVVFDAGRCGQPLITQRAVVLKRLLYTSIKQQVSPPTAPNRVLNNGPLLQWHVSRLLHSSS